jgi:hypothetical protein
MNRRDSATVDLVRPTKTTSTINRNTPDHFSNNITSHQQVTGKTKIEYFFNPSLLLPDESSSNPHSRTPLKRSTSINTTEEDDDALLYGSQHLFMPCVIVKDLEDEAGGGEHPALVKTKDGVLHKIRVSWT